MNIQASQRSGTSSDPSISSENDLTIFEEAGLDANAGWKTSAYLYMVGGALCLFSELMFRGIDLVWQARAAAVVAILMGPIFLWASKHLAPAGVWAHARMVFGLALMAWILYFFGDEREAMWPIVLFTIMAPAWLHAAKIAAIYASASILLVIVTLSVSASTTRLIVATFVLTLLALGINKQQQSLRKLAKLNRSLALIDPLTGVANLRLLRLQLQKMLDASGSGSTGIWALALDLDSFKLVNDRHSHTVGDRTIQEVAQSIVRTVRAGDIVARRGGDEFYVIPSAASNWTPKELIQRLELAIAQARLDVCPDLPSTVSIGCVSHQPGETLDTLLARADDALHYVKRAAHAGQRSLVVKRDSVSVAAPVELSEPAQGVRISKRRKVDLRWRWAAAGNFSCVAVCLLLGIAGLAPELITPLELALIALLASLGAWGFAQSKLQTSSRKLRVSNAGGAVLLALIVACAGASGPQIAELMFLPVVHQVIFDRKLVAWMTYGLAMTVFVGTNLAAGYEYWIPSAITTMIVLAVACGRLAGGQVATTRFIDRAIDSAELDPLTEIANVRGLRRAVERFLSEQSDDSLFLFAIDLDDFKQVNDLHSHQLGDETLRATARAIERAIGDKGVAARRGGDEFSAICNVGSHADAADLAVAISREIEAARMATCDDVLPTASVAFVCWIEGEEAGEFLIRADEELHQAKVAAHACRRESRTLYGATAS